MAPSRLQVAVVVGALGFWTALDGYFVVVAAPAIVIFFWSLPVPVFTWLVVVLRKTSVMEVDAMSIRRVLGRRVVTRVSFRDIGAVGTAYNPTLRLAVLRLRDRKGRVRLSFVSGARASVDDVHQRGLSRDVVENEIIDDLLTRIRAGNEPPLGGPYVPATTGPNSVTYRAFQNAFRQIDVPTYWP